MQINEYQEHCLRTAGQVDIINGVLGLCGEAGECADMVKKATFQGHELDVNSFLKELGDVAWYLSVSAYSVGCDLETVFRMNVEKLKQRYPEGFDADKSINRQDD